MIPPLMIMLMPVIEDAVPHLHSPRPVASAAPHRVKPTPRKPAASRARPASLVPGWAAGLWSRFPASVERSAVCIARHESANVGLWLAQNGRSSASGFAQWIDGTWRTQTQRAGVGTGYARAKYAPPATQAAVFAYQALHHGLYPWHGTGCPGT